MIFSQVRFQQSWALLPHIIRQGLWWLVPMGLLFAGLEYGVSYTQKMRFDSPYTTSTLLVISVGLGAFVLEALLSVAWVLVIAHFTYKKTSSQDGPDPSQITSPRLAFSHFHQVLIEYVRSIVNISLWTLLLILPGVIRWVHLSFVCLVSYLDKSYHQGKVDALKESTHLAKGRLLPLFILLFAIGSIPEALQTVGVSLAVWPITALFYSVAWILSILGAVYLTLTYTALHKAKLR